MLAEEFRRRGGNDFNLKEDMGRILAIEKGRCVNVEKNRENRRLFLQLLPNHKRKEVIFNPLLEENRISYLISMKIFLLRCRHSKLPIKNRFR